MKNYHKLIVTYQLPRLNEEINNAKKSPFKYSKTKKEHTNTIHILALEQLMNVKLKKGASFIIHWYMKNKTQDPDNSYFANKYIFDGLVNAGVLKDDRFDDVSGGVLSLPFIDKDNPRVEVFIFESPDLLHNFSKSIIGQ